MMNRRLQSLLELLRPTPPRDLQAAAQGRERFLAQVDTLPQPLPQASPRRRWWGFLPARKAWSPLATSMLVLVMLLSLGGVTIVAAHGSLPGQTLYAVKLLTEDTQLRMADSPQARLDLLSSFIDKRFVELDTLAAAGTPLPQALADRMNQQMESMLVLASDLDDSDLSAALTSVRQQLEDQKASTLMSIEPQPAGDDPVFIQIQDRVQEQYRFAEMGLDDVGQFRQQVENKYGDDDLDPGLTPGEQGTSSPAGNGEDPGSGNGSQGSGTESQGSQTAEPGGGSTDPGNNGQGNVPTQTPEPNGFGPGPNEMPYFPPAESSAGSEGQERKP